MKLFSILLCFTLTAVTCIAQDFKSGIRLGICGSQVSGDQLSGFNKAGVVAGIYVSRSFSEKIALQMEMVFIQKGSRKPVTVDNPGLYKLRLHYIEVPLMFHYHVSELLTVQAGPSFGVLVFSEEEDDFGVKYNMPPFNKYEFSGNVGVIYKLSDHWFVDFRYSFSIMPVRDYPGTYHYNYFDRGQYNSLFEIGMIYGF